MPGKVLAEIGAAEDGFTFLELLVVIILVGVLAAIALPAFLSQARKADDAEAKSELSGKAVGPQPAVYKIRKDASGIVHECTPPGRGGCQSDGTW